jgi:hypothetical protein
MQIQDLRTICVDCRHAFVMSMADLTRTSVRAIARPHLCHRCLMAAAHEPRWQPERTVEQIHLS